MVRMMLTRCWETTPFPRDRVDGCEAMLEISEREWFMPLSPTHLTKHFQSSSGWLVQVKKELIKPKGRKAANSLQEQKFDFPPSWKAQKGSQSSHHMP